jgi:hypothetical protein
MLPRALLSQFMTYKVSRIKGTYKQLNRKQIHQEFGLFSCSLKKQLFAASQQAISAAFFQNSAHSVETFSNEQNREARIREIK